MLSCGSKRLELFFKNTISLQLIFLYHGFEDACFGLSSFDNSIRIFYLLSMICLLTGSVHSGKTSFLKKTVYRLVENNIPVEGFLSVAVLGNHMTIGYDLYDLKKEKTIPFIRMNGKTGWQRVGAFFFIPQSLEKAKEIILKSKSTNILVVDEIGPLELSGEGLWPALKKIISDPSRLILFVVRDNCLDRVLSLLGRGEIRIFDVKKKGVMDEILRALETESKKILCP